MTIGHFTFRRMLSLMALVGITLFVSTATFAQQPAEPTDSAASQPEKAPVPPEEEPAEASSDNDQYVDVTEDPVTKDTYTPVDREAVPFEEMPGWMVADVIKKDWTLSGSAGYAMLWVNDNQRLRHGGGIQFMTAYNFDEYWSLGLKYDLSLLEGRKGDSDGIYSLSALEAFFSYTFLNPDYPVRPYLSLGFGWLYASYDREITTIFTTHAMVLEPGVGFVGKITPQIFMGVDVTASPIFFGKKGIKDSFIFKPKATLEYRF